MGRLSGGVRGVFRAVDLEGGAVRRFFSVISRVFSKERRFSARKKRFYVAKTRFYRR